MCVQQMPCAYTGLSPSILASIINEIRERDGNLRWAKTKIEKLNHKLVPIWFAWFPRKSSFIRCSRTHTTKPMKTKKQQLVSQRSQVKGFKNTHAFFFPLSVIGTTIDTPDSVYGNVKSTKLDLFAKIVMSPTTASKFCKANHLLPWFSWILQVPLFR